MFSFNPIQNVTGSHSTNGGKFEFLQICESYLAPLSSTKKVFCPVVYNKQTYTVYGQIVERSSLPIWKTALIVISYMTVILPICAATGMLIYRSANKREELNVGCL